MLSSADDKAAEASKRQDIFSLFQKRIGLFSPSQSRTYLQALHSQKF